MTSTPRHQPRTTQPAPLGLSHPSRTFITWTWSSQSPRRSRRRSGLLPIGTRRGDRPSIRSTAARNGVTSSPNGHVPSAGPRATGRTTPVAPACTAPTLAASGRTGGAVERSSRPAPMPTPPPVRARTREGLHALRSDGDLVAGRRDSTGRQVTACGAFARSARDRPSFAWHTDFIAGGPSSCRTCAAVLHVEPTPVATMLERALRYAAERRAAR